MKGGNLRKIEQGNRPAMIIEFLDGLRSSQATDWLVSFSSVLSHKPAVSEWGVEMVG